MSFAVKLRYETARSVNSTTFNNAYAAFGTPLDHSPVIVRFVNDSSQDIFISTDGTNDMDFIPAGGFALYDLTANKNAGSALGFSKGTQFYVKGAAAGTGLVYAIVLYASES